MDGRRAREAAEILWKLWSEGGTTDCLPRRCRPATVDEGWQVQRALDAHAGGHAGWKIAATSPAGQRHIGADRPLVGRLYEHNVVRSGAELNAGRLTMRSAEAEFGFRIGEDIPPAGAPPTPSDLAASIEYLLPAIEVPDSRFDDFQLVGLPSLVADAMCAAYVVVGEPVADWEPSALGEQSVRMHCNHREVAAGTGASVLGHPLVALGWLVLELAERGEMLRAGDLVITGASTPANPIAPGDRLTADFGELGTVGVGFVGRS